MCIKQREPAKNVLKKWKSIIDFFVSPNVVLHDGNGRTSRLIMNYQFLTNGFPAVSIAKENRLEYFNTLECYAVEGNLAPFADMIAQLVEQQLDRYLKMAEPKTDMGQFPVM